MVKKKQDILETVNIDIEKLSIQPTDILLLNIDSDDPNVVLSDDILDLVDTLGDTISDLIGFTVPIMAFSSEIFVEQLTQEHLVYLIERLQELVVDDTDVDDKDIIGVYE